MYLDISAKPAHVGRQGIGGGKQRAYARMRRPVETYYFFFNEESSDESFQMVTPDCLAGRCLACCSATASRVATAWLLRRHRTQTQAQRLPPRSFRRRRPAAWNSRATAKCASTVTGSSTSRPSGWPRSSRNTLPLSASARWTPTGNIGTILEGVETTTDDDFTLSPRIALGVQGDCWGLVVRYWRLDTGDLDSDFAYRYRRGRRAALHASKRKRSTWK